MTLSNTYIDIIRLCWKRRWAMLFLNMAAGLFAAPFLYWSLILMPVVLRAVHAEPVLLWMNGFSAAGGVVLLMLAAFGAGGCFSALRKVLRNNSSLLPSDVFSGMVRCAKTSLLVGAMLGISLGAANIGIINLHALQPAGFLRSVMTAFLLLQVVLTLPLCLLTFAQEDALQRRPMRALAEAGSDLAHSPLRMLGLLVLTLLPALLFFSWQQPALTLLGFVFMALCALTPTMLLWQGGAAWKNIKPGRKALPLTLVVFFVLTCISLAVPLIRASEMSLPDALTSLQSTMAFVARQLSENDALRNLLSASSVWPLLVAALLGSVCCILAAFACACYRFRLRGLVFTVAVLLQVLPMLLTFAALDQLLRKLGLSIPGSVLMLGWILLYLLTALLLHLNFTRMLPQLEANRARYPGIRLFFYYALRRSPLLPIFLIALVTLGCWNDALAPFWYMRTLGAFSIFNYVWERVPLAEERAGYIILFLVMLGGLTAWLKLRYNDQPKSRLPKPNGD